MVQKFAFETHLRGFILEIKLALKNQYTYNVPSGSSATSLTTSVKREFTDGWMDGIGCEVVSKVSFNFLYTLSVYKLYINVLIYRGLKLLPGDLEATY